MSILRFSDFEPYCATIANVDLRMRVLGLEYAAYSLSQAVVGQLQIQWAREGSGQLSEGMTIRHGIGMYMQLDPRPMRVNSLPIDPDAIVFFPPGSEFCFSCTHANSWFSVLVPLDVLGDASGNRDGALIDRVSVIRPGRHVADRLRSMVPAYLAALERNPRLGTNSTAVAAFQDEVVSIARRVCFRPADRHQNIPNGKTSLRVRHDRIASEAADLIEASLGRPLSVSGVARRLGASERTLSTAFHSRFGMAPRQFLHSMRLNRARHLLREKRSAGARVSEIAAACGYWDFGRFASRYQRLFGELPSDTLRG